MPDSKLQFIKVDGTDDLLVSELSALASAIVKEYYDPLLGPAQNDYMIEQFQSVPAIYGQIESGYRYMIVRDEGSSSGEDILLPQDAGFFGWYPRKDELYLSKFYLKADRRQHGYGRKIISYLLDEAAALGLRRISLNVNKYNESVEVYHKLGFSVVRSEVNDIGEGYVMDDFVMELPVRGAGASEETPEDPDALSVSRLLEILHTAEKLKCQTRHCDTSSGRRESVAEHSWRLALMAMLLSEELRKEFPALSTERIIRMCLIHDLGEIFTGDIPTFEKTKGDDDNEDSLLNAWIAAFPASVRLPWENLLSEMKALKTPESRVYKALDKLEALIQHNESDISTWLPLEYNLQKRYGWENVEFSPYLTKLREQVLLDTIQKIKEEG